MQKIIDFIAVFLFVPFCFAGEDYLVRNLSAVYQGKTLTCTLRRSVVTNTPAWNEQDLNPPLAPRVAHKLARSCINELIPDSKEWVLRSISLCEVVGVGGKEHWLYEVRFTPARGGEWVGPLPDFVIIVLMNGKVVPYEEGIPEGIKKAGKVQQDSSATAKN